MALRVRKGAKKIVNSARRKLLGWHSNVPKVAIVSCDHWKGKIYDDLLLQGEFLRQGMDAEIVSWQDTAVKWGDFAVAVVGSMWGYQNYLKDFEKWLDEVGKETTLVNSVAVVRANYDKVKQFRALERAGIPIIETQVIGVGGLKKFKLPEGGFVIKPAISGSGENTFLVRSSEDFEKVRSKLKVLNETKELLVQPFVPEIKNGELGVVVIGGEIMNVVRRFPGVIEGEYRVEVVGEADCKVKELVQKVVGLPEYKEAVYLRVDMVEREDGLVVMEVEAFEPQLFYSLLRGEARKKILSRMVAEVAKQI